MIVPYDTPPSELSGPLAEQSPRRAIEDHGLTAIIAACDDVTQLDRAVETYCVLYPSAPDAFGWTFAPTIQN